MTVQDQIDIKKAVQHGQVVNFQYYRDGRLWYETVWGDLFPVPVSDIGVATFNAKEKAILLMRYMCMWNEELVKDSDEWTP